MARNVQNGRLVHPGDRYCFHIGDVYLPGAAELLAALTEETELVGTLIELSDSGTESGVFAVVDLGSSQRVIVPVHKLRPIGPAIRDQTPRQTID